MTMPAIETWCRRCSPPLELTQHLQPAMFAAWRSTGICGGTGVEPRAFDRFMSEGEGGLGPREVELGTGTLCLRDDGIVHFRAHQGSQENLATSTTVMNAIEKLAAGRRVPILTDIRGNASADLAARRHYARESSRIGLAVAIVVDSGVSGVVANFFLRLNKVGVPTRLFTSLNEATQWLNDTVSAERNEPETDKTP